MTEGFKYFIKLKDRLLQLEALSSNTATTITSRNRASKQKALLCPHLYKFYCIELGTKNNFLLFVQRRARSFFTTGLAFERTLALLSKVIFIPCLVFLNNFKCFCFFLHLNTCIRLSRTCNEPILEHQASKCILNQIFSQTSK